MSGAGIAPSGTTPAGLSYIASSTSEGYVFRDERTGEQLAGRRIDERTRRYVFDDNGRILGMSGVRQKVLLALSTDEGSSAVRDFGNRLRSIKTIGASYEAELRNVVTYALRRLIEAREVEIVSLTASRVASGAALIHLRFRDLTTKQEQTITVR